MSEHIMDRLLSLQERIRKTSPHACLLLQVTSSGWQAACWSVNAVFGVHPTADAAFNELVRHLDQRDALARTLGVEVAA